MTIFVDERSQESSRSDDFALYIDGDFQFDTEDEALYHESLALPPLCLLRKSATKGIRVLICGGGDGLALRECLRFPGVAHVDLVDYSEEIVSLGKTRFAGVNLCAFSDPRVRVHISDAWEFLRALRQYDVILCDFTVPRKHEDTRVFTVEWYERLRSALTPGGIMGINAVSPQVTPEAFWCLNKTINAARLRTVPYRVCIPSFRDHGYGVWAFMLAAHHSESISVKRLKAISSPVPTRLTDLSDLWRGARFGRAERRMQLRAPINDLRNGCLLPLLLNPTLPDCGQLSSIDPNPYDLNPLLSAIPISHPYHTRIMIETLAEQVAGSVRDLDIPRLIDALMRRAAALPAKLIAELGRLRDYLKDHTPRFELFSEWSYRLFAALVIMMTLANAISPDNAFAKGSFGAGAHGGYSVGHSGFSSEGSSFGGSVGSSSGADPLREALVATGEARAHLADRAAVSAVATAKTFLVRQDRHTLREPALDPVTGADRQLTSTVRTSRPDTTHIAAAALVTITLTLKYTVERSQQLRQRNTRRFSWPVRICRYSITETWL